MSPAVRSRTIGQQQSPVVRPIRLPPSSPPGAERVPPPRPSGERGSEGSRVAIGVPPASLSEETPVVRKSRRRNATDLRTRLLACLRTRASAEGEIYLLDLRGKAWVGICPNGSGRLTLRNPDDPGWPNEGRTTTKREIAEHWVEVGYLPWLDRKAEIVDNGPNAGILVCEACKRYLEALILEYGPDHNTVRNRRSACTVHIIPAFGGRPLDSLSKAQVRAFLTGLTVVRRQHGETERVPAELRTKSNIRAAICAIWNHVYPDVSPPFAGIRLTPSGASRRRRAAAESGEIEELIDATAYTHDETVRLLLTAMRYDREVLGRPNLRASFLLNTAEAFALILGTAARIEEATFLRWKHIRWKERAILIPGTKTVNSPRWIPLQQSLVPWLERLQALQGGAPAANAFVLQTRRGRPTLRPSRKTYGARIARVETLAGLKRHRKATHNLRATHLSWAKDHLSLADLKTYAGHGAARGGATDAYIDASPPFMPAEHRTFLQLPTPDTILRLLDEQRS